MNADLRGCVVIGLAALIASCSVFDSADEEKTGRPFAQLTSVDVLDVIDGDTIVVDINSEQVQVRLIGIDAPEAGECWADEATSMLRRLVGQHVELAIDQSDRDQHGRLLRYVIAGGTGVNAEMVRLGAAIARPYPPDTSREKELEAAQRAARQAEAGLWNPTACGPEDSSQLAITEISADPPGEDALDLNGEYVDLTNRGATAVNLGGWIVRDESASHRFTIPEGFVLAAGATVRLHTGCGSPSDSALFWCMQASTVWNNDGDTVFVQDSSGNIVASRSY